MRFETWNIRSLYRVDSLMTVSRELSRYRLDFVELQVRWDGSGTEQAGEDTFFYVKGNENHELGTVCEALLIYKCLQNINEEGI
jgi:hypothetical protein